MLFKNKTQFENYYKYQERLLDNKNKLSKHSRFLFTYFVCFILFPCIGFISLVLHIFLNIWIPVFYYNWSDFYNLNNTVIPKIVGNLFLVPNLILNIAGVVDVLLLLFSIFFFCILCFDKITPFCRMPNIFKSILFINFLFLIISTVFIYFLIWILNNSYNPTLDFWALNPSISLSLSIGPVLINVSIILTISTIFVNFSFVSFIWFVLNNKFYSISLNLLRIVKYVKSDNELKHETIPLLTEEFKEEQKPYEYLYPFEKNSNFVADQKIDYDLLTEEIEKMIIDYDND